LKKFTKPWKAPKKKKIERKERQEKQPFFKRKETLTPIHPALKYMPPTYTPAGPYDYLIRSTEHSGQEWK
jgi:hypothetical protein